MVFVSTESKGVSLKLLLCLGLTHEQFARVKFPFSGFGLELHPSTQAMFLARRVVRRERYCLGCILRKG